MFAQTFQRWHNTLATKATRFLTLMGVSGCLLLLSACASTSPSLNSTRHYQLPESAFRLPETPPTIGVNIQLAEPLKSGSLLYQTSPHTLHFAQNHLWAAPLDQSLASALSNKLNRAQPMSFAPSGQLNTPNTLTIYLDRFQGRYTGETEISGYARWPNGKQTAFHVITPQIGDGYAAMTESLNQGLDEVVKQIQ